MVGSWTLDVCDKVASIAFLGTAVVMGLALDSSSTNSLLKAAEEVFSALETSKDLESSVSVEAVKVKPSLKLSRDSKRGARNTGKVPGD
jgi:hypothetical protein